MRVFIVTTAIIFCCQVEAQALQYLDEAGNIHYADSIEQVPTQYRKQLGVDPAPPPTTLAKGKGRASAKKKKSASSKAKKKKKSGKKSGGKKGKKGGKPPAPAPSPAAAAS